MQTSGSLGLILSELSNHWAASLVIRALSTSRAQAWRVVLRYIAYLCGCRSCCDTIATISDPWILGVLATWSKCVFTPSVVTLNDTQE